MSSDSTSALEERVVEDVQGGQGGRKRQEGVCGP